MTIQKGKDEDNEMVHEYNQHTGFLFNISLIFLKQIIFIYYCWYYLNLFGLKFLKLKKTYNFF